jgi:phosphohistidine swiveling domain-containing protein|tara:strand:+ start:310 stop:756 length:447 start_codon:yes stop_codon:yes gene_type:complete
MRPTVGKEIRKIIRELLVEEIASINKESVSLDQKTTREVIVSIRTDEDLMKFVKKILNIVKETDGFSNIENGDIIFHLDVPSSANLNSRSCTSHPTSNKIEDGLITEYDIAKLDGNITVLQVLKNAKLTPLAKDELRKKGIKMERTQI